jgi:hypothetical protein
MTRSQIRDRILNALNESTSSPVFWTTAQLDAVIGEASEVLAEEAKAIRRTAFVGRQAGAIYYSTRGLAPDVMAITRIWLPDLNKRLTAVSIAELDGQNSTWPEATGDPEYWFPVSWDVFGIYPHPATSGGLLRVDYLAWPRTLLDDDDEPEFREADHDSLVMYGIYDGLLKMWNAPRALELYNRFLDQWQTGRARSGIRETQARTFQRPNAPGQPFQSGVTRG